MTAFGKLIRTTAFRLTLVYLFLFALFAASLLGYFAWNTRRLINEQITATVSAETAEIVDIYTRRGLHGRDLRCACQREVHCGLQCQGLIGATRRERAGEGQEEDC